MPVPDITLRFQRSPSLVRLQGTHAQSADVPQPTNTPEDDNRLQEQLEYLQNLLNDVGCSVEELQQQHRDSLKELQQATIELATIAASWIVGAAIDADVFAVDDLVDQMLDQLRDEQPVRIRMNTDDATLLQSLRQASDTPDFTNAEVEFVSDPNLKRGTVRAESSRSTLMTDLDGRLADIRRIWMENLNETQTERRADEPTGGKLRRFPERRHTA